MAAVGRLYVPFLIAGMLITGCSNSIFSKYQDMQCVERCDDPDPRRHLLFEQPVWQTLTMFLGEMFCFIPILYGIIQKRYFNSTISLPSDEDEAATETTALSPKGKVALKELRGWAILLMWLPALGDLMGTTFMMIGLLYTPVSIYQMTRGALVLWVGLFSVVFLRRHLWLYQWLSLVTVMVGVSLVGLSGSLAKSSQAEDGIRLMLRVLEEPEPATTVFVGILFILFAQVFTATQFVIEEKILSTYNVPPLLAVGYEGFFGALSILLLFPLLAANKQITPFFDLSRGWDQMISNKTVLWTSFASACSIAFFNGFGLAVTKHVNATARSTADTCRTIGIWIVSLILGWEKLTWPWTPMQLTGFAVLVYGTFVFNNLARPPAFIAPSASSLAAVDGQAQPLLSDDDVEERHNQEVGRTLDETAVLPVDLSGSGTIGGYDVVPPSPTKVSSAGTQPRGVVVPEDEATGVWGRG